MEIAGMDDTISVLNVHDITGHLQRINYEVIIEHPNPEALVVNIVSTDNRTLTNIWQRQSAGAGRFTIEGETFSFNAIPPNGDWRLQIRNLKEERGILVRWQLAFTYINK
jgi:subtilisin-like proprotein convertase family protein